MHEKAFRACQEAAPHRVPDGMVFRRGFAFAGPACPESGTPPCRSRLFSLPAPLCIRSDYLPVFS
jgi:hypothetical protein